MDIIIRNSAAAGQFYPRSSRDIESMIDKFSRRADVEKRDVLGGVVPHAGYMYCGETQAHVYESILDDTSTFVILGPNHSSQGTSEAIMTSGMWKTPLGGARIDTDLANSILQNSDYLEDDYTAHNQEHSIEVQLPWLQKKFRDFNFVPISMSKHDLKRGQDIGKALRKAREETSEKFVVLASSDFTHFGTSYGYKPVTGGIGKKLDYIKKIDTEAASAVEKLSPETFVDTVERYNATICGVGPIVSMLYYLEDIAKGGDLLDYSTSYEVSKNEDSMVGYCGIVLE
ncbi:MAG: AmmeMemoRadiSam system protein B [Candidatus Aenigmatarchaeota archaeon]